MVLQGAIYELSDSFHDAHACICGRELKAQREPTLTIVDGDRIRINV